MANRNAYHKEYLAMSKSLQAKAADGPSGTPPGDSPIVSQKTTSPSKGKQTVQRNSTEAKGSKRTREVPFLFSLVSVFGKYDPLTNMTNGQRALASISKTSSSSPASSNLRATASHIPTRTKQQEPDVLTALERYLDDLDARLQLERELMAHVSKQPAQK